MTNEVNKLPESLLITKLFYYLAGFIVFCFLPLLAWGISDLPTFFANPFRLAYILLMSVSMIFVVIFVPQEGRGTGEGETTVKRQRLVISYLKIAAPTALVVSAFSDKHVIFCLPDTTALRFAGLILAAIGYFFMNWSIVALGRQFSLSVTIQSDHQLVTKGPFKIIRHPRYLGLLLFFSGVSLIFVSMLGLIIFALTFLVILWRIRDEEQLLKAQFGAEWDDYRKRTYNLIPFLF